MNTQSSSESELKDSNHTIYYFFIRLKRQLRDITRGDLFILWLAAEEGVNAMIRVLFGFIGTIFNVLADICLHIRKASVKKQRLEVK